MTGDDGSPPRLWGKRHVTDAIAIARTVHPHACGENPFRRCRDSDMRGSPPRLWGKLASAIERKYVKRFTPTPVGKTAHPDRRALQGAVHPHACGENIAVMGDSPETVRFTPTPVGKTRSFGGGHLPICGSPPRLWGKRIRRYRWAWGPSVHPHACGENAEVASNQI